VNAPRKIIAPNERLALAHAVVKEPRARNVARGAALADSLPHGLAHVDLQRRVVNNVRAHNQALRLRPALAHRGVHFASLRRVRWSVAGLVVMVHLERAARVLGLEHVPAIERRCTRVRARVSCTARVGGRTEPKVKQLSCQVLLEIGKKRGKAEWIRSFSCTCGASAGHMRHGSRDTHCTTRHRATVATSSSYRRTRIDCSGGPAPLLVEYPCTSKRPTSHGTYRMHHHVRLCTVTSTMGTFQPPGAARPFTFQLNSAFALRAHQFDEGSRTKVRFSHE